VFDRSGFAHKMFSLIFLESIDHFYDMAFRWRGVALTTFVLVTSDSSAFVATGRQHAIALISSRQRQGIVKVQHMATPPLDEDDAYETDRLARDAEAMATMKQESELFSTLRSPWKWVIRKRIWDLMEETNIARDPRPVHHRIPNFDGAHEAAARLASLPEFQAAKCVKVNPDTPQRPVRKLVLQKKKILLTPQPRLRTGFFSTIDMALLPSGIKIDDCTTSVGVAKHGSPVSLNDTYTVDLVIVGSTAVCPNTGARVGKGEGFAELEWGILSLQGNLNPETTLVVTTVHDEQVVTDIPLGQLTKHDVPVDIIVTPTRIIRVPNRVNKPSGVFWDLLSPQKLAQIKVLRDLKGEIESEQDAVLPSGPEEVLPPTASRGAPKKGKKPVTKPTGVKTKTIAADSKKPKSAEKASTKPKNTKIEPVVETRAEKRAATKVAKQKIRDDLYKPPSMIKNEGEE
jgi:5-formyltetrahydrofolate cyclo-ligase